MVEAYEDAALMSKLFGSFADMSKPQLVAKIARELRKFHQVDIPGSKEPQLWNDIFKFLDKGCPLISTGLFWCRLMKLQNLWPFCVFLINFVLLASVVKWWSLSISLDAAISLKFSDDSKQEKYETISFEEIHSEITKLKVPPSSQVLFLNAVIIWFIPKTRVY